MLLFDEFSYLYLFLDWTQDKEKKSKGKKGREARGGEDEHGEGEVGSWCGLSYALFFTSKIYFPLTIYQFI